MFSGLLDAYKRELGEFVSTVTEDTSRVVSSAAEKLKQINEDHALRRAGGQPRPAAKGVVNNPSRLAAVDFATFLEECEAEQDAGFEDFTATFDLDSRKDHLDDARVQVSEEFGRWVPAMMEEQEFWTKYFYFQHVQRRARLLAGDGGEQDDEDDLSWGDDDDHLEALDAQDAEEDARAAAPDGPQESSEERATNTPSTSEAEADLAVLREALASSEARARAAEARAEQLEFRVRELSELVEALQSKLSESRVRSEAPEPALAPAADSGSEAAVDVAQGDAEPAAPPASAALDGEDDVGDGWEEWQ